MSGMYSKKCVEDIWDTSEDALPFKLQRVAEEELGETPQKRREAVEKLLRLLDAETQLNANRDVGFLLRFLRVRKYNVDAALQTINNYYRNRAASRDIYSEFVPSTVSPAARQLVMVLPEPDVLGRPILLWKPGLWIPEELTYADVHKACLICLEHMASNPVTQTLGMVVLIDYDQFSVDKLLHINMGLLRKALQYVQDCMPMRMKAVHLVRQSHVFDMIFAILKPFMKAKLAGRFRFHGENFDSLREEIHPKSLPQEYGGQATTAGFEAFWDQVDAEEGVFEASNRYGCSGRNVDEMTACLEQPRELTSL